MNRRQINARRVARLCWGAAVLLAVIILVATLTPSDNLPDMDGGVDKLWHFLAFAALVFPPVLWRPRNAWLVVPLASAFGLGIEFIQPLFGRGFEWSDWIADTAGAVAGAGLAALLHRPVMRWLQPVADADAARGQAGGKPSGGARESRAHLPAEPQPPTGSGGR